MKRAPWEVDFGKVVFKQEGVWREFKKLGIGVVVVPLLVLIFLPGIRAELCVYIHLRFTSPITFSRGHSGSRREKTLAPLPSNKDAENVPAEKPFKYRAAAPNVIEVPARTASQPTAPEGLASANRLPVLPIIPSVLPDPPSPCNVSNNKKLAEESQQQFAARPFDDPFRRSEPIRLVWRPAAQYTQEALAAHIRGEVQVCVLVHESGTVEVKGVLKGLGYGLDETAVQAALHAQFEPARENGRPIAAERVMTIPFDDPTW